MERITSIHQLWGNYPHFKNELFEGRYLLLENVEAGLDRLPSSFRLKTEGSSVEDRPIRSVSFGTGKTKILMWSQMHGNETTTTKAVFDLLKSFALAGQQPLLQDIATRCTIKIIPVLNPDGAVQYTRANANNVDLNRDAQNLSQPESRVLNKIFNEFQPDFCFNLHDQRSIYSAGKVARSAVVSFLAPSYDLEKSINKTREISMKLIAVMHQTLQKYIPDQIGRYDDAFNEHCVGDTFQSLGVPTLLFEAGHFPGDYQRETTRKLVYIALTNALTSISTGSFDRMDPFLYWKIPANETLFYDVIFRNVKVNGKSCDLGIQYEEQLQNGKIEFRPIIQEIGDLLAFYGHREYNGKGQVLVLDGSETIQKGVLAPVLNLGNEKILLKLQ